MAKASINKNYKLSAKGVLGLDEDGIIGIENPDTGEFIELSRLFVDFLESQYLCLFRMMRIMNKIQIRRNKK